MSSKILLPQLVSMLAAEAGRPKKQAESFLKAFFTTIAETLQNHDNVKIKGFGTFKIIRVESRKSVNVSTGDAVQIPAHYKVSFTPDKALAEKVNKEFSWLEVVELSDNVSNEELESLDEGTGVTSNSSQGEEIEMSPSETVEIQLPESMVENEVPEIIGETHQTVNSQTPSFSESREEPAVEKQDIVAEPVVEKKSEELEKIEASVPLNIDKEEEERSERLGEELEKEFGDIEPVEPFGPVDPDDPEPGEPIPDNSIISIPADFDPYSEDFDTTEPEEEVEEIEIATPPPDVYYITKDEYVTLVKKADLKPYSRNIKRIKASVEKCNEQSKKNSRNALIWSVVISAALMIGGFFLLYFLLYDRMGNTEKRKEVKVEKTEPVYEDEIDDYPTTISGLGNSADTPAQTKPVERAITVEPEPEKPKKVSGVAKNENSTAPTSPSDIKAMDKITTTRYLTTMAKEHYGNYNLWPYIYIENEGKLGHPDRIKPGTMVVIPNIEKYGINPANPKDIEKARKLGVEIYKKFTQ